MSDSYEIEFDSSEVLPDSCQTLKSLCELSQLANLFPQTPKTWSTGIQALDEHMQLESSTVTLIAARPGMGKTRLMLTIAHHLAVTQCVKTAYFSLKSSANTLFKRLIAVHEQIDINAVQLSALEQSHSDAFNIFCRNENLIIDDTPRLKPTELCERIRQLKRQQHIDVVFIDNLQLINPYDQSTPLDTATICRILHGLAEELDIALFLSCNLNAELEKRDSKMPRIADLIDMNIPLRYAEQVILLHRNHDSSEQQTSQLFCILCKESNQYQFNIL